MPTSEWQELLGRSGVRNLSRADIEQQLIALPVTTGATSIATVSGTGASEWEISNLPASPASQELTRQMTSLVSQITNLNATQLNQISALEGNTQALAQNTTARGPGGSSVGSTISGIATSF